MKNLFFIPVIFFLLTFQKFTFTQTINEIITKHFEAVNQAAFNNVKTIVITSEIIQPGGKIPVKTYFKRPDKMRIETIEDGKTSITAYDGKIGWCISPEDYGLTPTELTGKSLDETKFMANLDGYFFCYKDRSLKTTLEGKEKILGKDVYKIKCNVSPVDSAFIFIDKNTFLILKVKQPVQNGYKETFLSDYRKINNMIFPFRFEIMTPYSRTFQIIKNIEFDKIIPDSFFSMPHKSS